MQGINIQSVGKLDQCTITDLLGTPYKWESLERIAQIFTYCLLYQCDQQQEYIRQIKTSTIPMLEHEQFIRQFINKMQQETQANIWDCMKYLFYPEPAKIPDQESQRKLSERYIIFVVGQMIHSGNLIDYIQQNSNFITQAAMELDTNESWWANLQQPDLRTIRQMYDAMCNASIAFMEYLIAKYDLAENKDQKQYYLQMKQNMYKNTLFQNHFDKDSCIDERPDKFERQAKPTRQELSE